MNDRKGTKGRKRSGDGDPVGPSLRRFGERLFVLKVEHVTLLRELDRLFPERAPIVDFRRIPPGGESVESVSAELHRALCVRFEQPLFLALCHVNAERLLDRIAYRLEFGAYPLVADEVLSDVYVNYYRRMRAGEAWPGGSSTFDLFAELVERQIREKVEFLASCALPLPGLKLPPLEVGDSVLLRFVGDVDSSGGSIPRALADHWIAHALLRMSERSRRVLFLRERLGLSMVETANRMELEPFAAGLMLRHAWLELSDLVERTRLAFGLSERPSGVSRVSGKLLTMPSRTVAPIRSIREVRVSEDERESDE